MQWFGLILDIGGLHAENPYDEIQNWLLMQITGSLKSMFTRVVRQQM